MNLLRNRMESAKGQRGWSMIEVMAAIVVVGIGVALFMRVHNMSRQGTSTNAKVMIAGKMIEKFLEDTRIAIARDTLANWPPASRTISPTLPNNITLICRVGNALSPKDGAIVANVKLMEIVAYWYVPYKDSLKVTTYVAKRF